MAVTYSLDPAQPAATSARFAQRMAGFAGLAFAILVALVNIAIGATAPPAFDAPAGEILPWVTDNRALLMTVAAVVPFGVIFLYAFGWYFAGVPYWFVLGILAGILNIIPYASGLFWPVAILLKYVDTITVHPMDGSFLSIVVWPSMVFFVVQFLEGWILTPWVQGEQMEMSVPTVLIVVFLGGAIGGFMGLLFCLPIYACLKILFQEFVHPKIMQWTLK